MHEKILIHKMKNNGEITEPWGMWPIQYLRNNNCMNSNACIAYKNELFVYLVKCGLI